MSDIQQTPKTASKTKSKRRTWVQERRQNQFDRRLVEDDPISSMSTQIFEDAQRRASVQGIDATLMTPPIEPEECTTQSCPTSAIHDIHHLPAARAVTPESVKVASQLPDAIDAASQKVPTITIDTSSVTASNTADTTTRSSTTAETTRSTTTAGMSEHQTFATLAEHNFFIPPTASLNASSLILFKHDTPSLERFRLLHNQLFIELGRVVEEQLQPPQFAETNAEAYGQKEQLMLGLLTEVVPALNHLTERVGKEIKSSMEKHEAGLRLWAGERKQKEEGA